MNWNEYFQTFLQIGAYVPQTLVMAIIGMALAIIVGIVLLILSKFRASNWFVKLYLLIFRGFPTLVILFVGYFGIPELLHIANHTSALAASIICLALKSAAYLEEIFRSGLAAVSSSQIEAGKSLGMSTYQVYRYIIAPQAIQVMIPNIGNNFISLLKETSLAFSIGATEIFGQGKLIATENFQYFSVYLIVGIWYVILIYIYTLFQQLIERHYSWSV